MDTGSKKLSVLGDSISKHYGPYLKRALRGVFDYDRKRNPGDRVEDLDKPVGANGGDSVQVLEYLERQADRAATYCDVVLINGGLHDIRRRGGEDRLQVQPARDFQAGLEIGAGGNLDPNNAGRRWTA